MARSAQVRSEKPETRIESKSAGIFFSFLVSGFSLLVFYAAGAWAQDPSAHASGSEPIPHADANGWAPAPPAIPRTFSSRSPTPVAERPMAENARSSSYVNPSTGSMVPVPPPPPKIPFDEWTSAAKPSTSVIRASVQQPPGPAKDVRAPGEEEEVKIQLEPPGPDRIFGRRDSERSLMIRIQQEVRQQKRQPVDFPSEPILSTEKYTARLFPPMTETVEPNYTCYGRLLFEDKNSERYGWDLGFIQPFVSTGIFFWDVAWLPYHLASEPCRHYECNSGYCLPGDPVPYLIYPPVYSVTGAAAEIGTVVFLSWIFPG